MSFPSTRNGKLHLALDSAPLEVTSQVVFSPEFVNVTASPIGGTGDNDKPTRKRAKRACSGCRARKVRCDVLECMPCTNCRLDAVPCILADKKSRVVHCKESLRAIDQCPRRAVSNRFEPLTSKAGGIENPIIIPTSCMLGLGDQNTSVQIKAGDAIQGLFTESNDNSCLNQQQIHKLTINNHHRSGSASNLAPDELHFEFNLRKYLVDSASSSSDLDSSSVKTPLSLPNYTSLPVYIKPLPECMLADDVYFIWRKGALSIPETTFRNQLIQCYIDYVYPYLPAIDLHSFLRIVNQENGESGKISLLLFQAIMFAGTAFVDIAFLEKAGYQSRIAARKAFYMKTRVLYDSDHEVDCVALVQSLLLMTYWYETPDPKDPWHWMGIVSSLVHTAGIYRNQENSRMDIKTQRLWRRIWWSCYMRDRIVTLGSSRPTRIKDEDHDIPMLTLTDFEIDVFPAEILGLLPDCAFIHDKTLQTDLAVMCIAKAKLCMCITHILSGCFNLMRDQDAARGERNDVQTDFMLFPEKKEQIDKIQLCDLKLREWYQQLSSRFTYTAPNTVEEVIESASFIVHRTVLHMVYLAAVSSLHRLLVLPLAAATTLQKYHYYHNLHDISYTIARTASLEISKISFDIQNLKLEMFLPSYSLTALLPSIMINLRDLKSPSGTIREKALQGFRHSTHLLRKLRDCYSVAEYATQFLRAAVKTLGVEDIIQGGILHEDGTSPDSASTSSQTPSQGISVAETTRPQGYQSPYTRPFASNHSLAYFGTESTDGQNLRHFEETAFTQQFDSIGTNFGWGGGMTEGCWDDVLEGVMNGESGCLFMDLNWT